jgi:hypothetical protein
MRKTLTLFVTILSLLLLAVPVYATEADTKGADVSYTVTSSYAWAIHGDIDFGEDLGAAGATVAAQIGGDPYGVKVTQNRIEQGKKLHITINTANGFKVKSGTVERSYQVFKDGGSLALTAGGTILDLAAGTNTQNVALSFVLSGAETEIAGNYADRVTYTAAVVDA